MILGAPYTGINSLQYRYVAGEYHSRCEFEDIDDFPKNEIVDGQQVRINLYEYKKDPDYEIIYKQFIRQSHGFVIVYSIDDRQSFERVTEFYNDLTRFKETTNIPVVLCATKCDLEDKRVVSANEGEELAAQLNIDFFETSAYSGLNIDNLFVALIRKVLQSRPVKEEIGCKTTKDPKGKYVCIIS